MATQTVPASALIAGLDFSTGSVKGLIFDLQGNTVAEVRLPTDLWTEGGVSELSLLQLEGQGRAVIRALAARLREQNRLEDWLAIGISATHHTAGRIDQDGNPVRRMICWNDQTLAQYHAVGLQRLGGQERARELTGGPWAVRYSLSHLLKDEATLSDEDWQRTAWLVPHGVAAAGFLTGKFERISLSTAASTGLLDLRTGQWRKEMLEALELPQHREMAWSNLPQVLEMPAPIGPLAEHIAYDAGLPIDCQPLVFPTLDDQAAGLLGGGAVNDGELAIILGNSAVVNSSSDQLPQTAELDAMKTNWGPYLWMRCYSNGAQFLDKLFGPKPDWAKLEKEAREVPACCTGVSVLPFVLSEPSLGVNSPRMEWTPKEATDAGVRLRAAFEAIAYLIALGVKEHERAGQEIHRITVSGGISRSDLMVEILASVLARPVQRLESDEGPALGAAVLAFAGLSGFQQGLNSNEPVNPAQDVAEAVKKMVRFRSAVEPNTKWQLAYQTGLCDFAIAIGKKGLVNQA